jgi:hypothetical protein
MLSKCFLARLSVNKSSIYPNTPTSQNLDRNFPKIVKKKEKQAI